MGKYLFEQMGGTYTQVGDYLLPNLTLTEQETNPIGLWEQRHLRYIKQHKHIFYANLLTACKLNSYLAQIEKQAEDMFLRLVKEIVEREGVTEQLKAENQMEWIAQMNNIRNRVTGIIYTELIFT